MNNLFAQNWAVRFMLIAVGCVAIVAGMHAIASILNPIFIAVLFAVLFDMPRSWMVRRGMSEGRALVVTILGALVVTLLFLFLIGTTVLNLSASLPEFQEQIQTQLEELGEMLGQAGIQVDQLKTVAQSEQTNPLGVLTYVLGGVASVLASAVAVAISMWAGIHTNLYVALLAYGLLVLPASYLWQKRSETPVLKASGAA